jgi:general secretion pathway protein D
MKTYFMKNIGGAALAILLGAAVEAQAQPRGGFGGFGGFGNFGGNNANRGGSTTSAYNNNGSVGSATITVDPQTHNLVVIADEETAMQISNVLASLDAPKPQVLIKVVFLEVQRNNDLDIGIEGGYVNNRLGSGISGSAANVFGLAGANSVVTNFSGMGQVFAPALAPGPGGANGFYQIMGKDFQATLKAIAASGKAQILSRPSILARDGQLAKIVVGQEVFLPSGVSQQSATGITPITTINGSYTEIGIILNVTPFIGANGLVEMIVQPQISSIDQTTPGQAIANGGTLGGGTIYAPNLNIRSADTVVVTPEGQPVVIGGLISNSKSQSDSKVPLLGDIPLLGMLFKASSKNDSKNELIMFLTPHIVESPAKLAALTPGELNQATSITNTINEQELNRFLERVPAKHN